MAPVARSSCCTADWPTTRPPCPWSPPLRLGTVLSPPTCAAAAGPGQRRPCLSTASPRTSPHCSTTLARPAPSSAAHRVAQGSPSVSPSATRSAPPDSLGISSVPIGLPPMSLGMLKWGSEGVYPLGGVAFASLPQTIWRSTRTIGAFEHGSARPPPSITTRMQSTRRRRLAAAASATPEPGSQRRHRSGESAPAPSCPNTPGR